MLCWRSLHFSGREHTLDLRLLKWAVRVDCPAELNGILPGNVFHFNPHGLNRRSIFIIKGDFHLGNA